MRRLFLLLLCVAVPWYAHANCANDTAQIKLALPPDSLAIRNALFAKLCESGDLLDDTDPDLAGKLTHPRDFVMAGGGLDSEGVRGKGLFAFEVDREGSIHKVTVITSTGNAGLDKRTVRFWESSRYKTPAKLNGSPVRLLMYFKFKSIVNGS